jgi:Tol biopolymer transport system component
MPLSAGTRIGPYEVTAKLGEGGMGEVYRARDPKLGRDVAIKILPEQWQRDAERLARFDREARVLAQINHPNIAAIYGREQAEDVDALVLELVEGPTLAEMPRLDVPEALGLARQIASALEAAHAAGIVHRDVKPGNIKVRPDGTVKVLDFGLAKIDEAAEASGGAERIANSPTLTAATFGRGTELGVILGTAAYMAPEQARGKRVDRRADIWAFGCVLFEMLTGRRAFEGEDVTDTLAAIVRAEPAWDLLPPDTPAVVRRVLRRCLQKDPAKRLRDIGDARLEIEEARENDREEATEKKWKGGTERRFTAREIAAWALAAAAAITAGWLWFTRAGADPASTADSITFQLGELDTSDTFEPPTYFELSPDGQHLAFVAQAMEDKRPYIWVRSLASSAVRRLDGTAGAARPFWSPDSRQIAFSGGGQLRKVSLSGGLPQTIAAKANVTSGGTWSGDGTTIVFGSSMHLFRVPATGGEPEQLTTAEDVASTGPHRWPAFLADGRHFVTLTMNEGAVYLSSIDSTARTRLFVSSSKVLPLGRDRLLFVRDGTLLAQPIDPATYAVTGEPVPVATDLFTTSFTGNTGGGGSSISASPSGALLYRPQREGMNELVWVDRSGKQIDKIARVANYQGIDISPDDTRLAYHLHSSEGGDVFILDLARGAETRLTNSPATHNSWPLWIGNDRVAFSNLAGERRELQYVRVAPFDPKPTVFARPESSPAASDGSHVVYHGVGGLWVHTLDSKEPDRQIAQGAQPHLSPDGRWLAFQSGRSGRNEIYVQRYGTDAEPVRVSVNGGGRVRWSRTGIEVFFLSGLQMMAATIRFKGDRAEPGEARPLFEPDLECASCAYFPYAVGPGDRFLLIRATDRGRPHPPATWITNWRR